MCFGGGGKSAEEMYQEMKPEFGPLPSLSMKRIVTPHCYWHYAYSVYPRNF